MTDTTTPNRRFGLKPFSLLAIEATYFSLFNATNSWSFLVYCRKPRFVNIVDPGPIKLMHFNLFKSVKKIIKHFKFMYNNYLPTEEQTSCCLPFQTTLRYGLLLRLAISYSHVFKALSRFAYVQSLRCCLDILNNDTRVAACYKIAHLRFRNV